MAEGTRLQLSPAITDATIKDTWRCTGACFTIAKALQRYGMYIADGGGRPKIMPEFEGTAHWNGDPHRQDAVTDSAVGLPRGGPARALTPPPEGSPPRRPSVPSDDPPMRLPGAIAAALALAAVSGSAVAAGLRQDAPQPSIAPGPTCERPYSASSPWNTEVAADAAVDPASAAKVATMDPDNAKLTSDPTQFTFPVYYADASTPRVPVTHVDGWFSDVSDSFSEVFAGGTTLFNARQRDPAQRVTTMPIPPGDDPRRRI